MASPTNRGRGGPGQQTGTYGAGGSTTTTQGQRSESGGVASGLMEKAQDLASNLGTTAEEAWDSAREGIESAASAVADTAGDAFDSVTSFMRRYPFATLGFGFGLGFLCGRLLAGGGMPDFFRGGSRYNWWDEESRQARGYGR